MKEITEKIHEAMARIGRPVRLMEVCGTHTVAIFRHGIRSLLPAGLSLLSGPGCPVCVTASGDIDAAISLALDRGVTLTTFGDMIRVPGGRGSLGEARAEGADVRIVYSPLDALAMAEQDASKEVVFFATGFETTAPMVAATLCEAERRDVKNFLVYSVHKLVPPALAALMASGDVLVDGFILPGHVSAIIGSLPYGFLASQHGKCGVITGFEASDILQGIAMLLAGIESEEKRIEIQYDRIVRPEGNPRAVAVMEKIFEPADAHWRGIGVILGSGLALRESFAGFDALKRFGLSPARTEDPSACRCGDVLRGVRLPPDCRLFGKACTPDRPVGPCMVSAEGSCAAFFKYGGVA